MEQKRKEILDEAKEHINEWFGFYAKNLNIFDYNKRFCVLGGKYQWEQCSAWDSNDSENNNSLSIADYRTTSGKAAKTLNQLYIYCKLMESEFRRNMPQIKLTPKIDNLNPEKSLQNWEYLESLMRLYAYNSDAEYAYQELCSNCLYGFGGLYIPYVLNEETLLNEFQIKNVEPCFCVWDIGAQSKSKIDGDFCAVGTIFKKEYIAEVYNIDENEVKTLVSPYQSQSVYLGSGIGVSNKNVVIWDYYRKEYKKTTYVITRNGDKLLKDEYRQKFAGREDKITSDDIIANEVTIPEYNIKHYRLIDSNILEDGEYPNKYLPLIFASGDVKKFGASEIVKAFIDDAKEPQRKLNVLYSEFLDYLATARKGGFLGTRENFTDEQINNQFRQANPNQSVTIVKRDSMGQLPTFVPPTQIPQELLIAMQNASLEIQQAIGLFGANLGQQTNEISGIAIENRRRQGEGNVYMYFDNIRQAIASAGKIIYDGILKTIKNKRKITAKSKNGALRTFEINNFDAKEKNLVSSLNNFDIEIESGLSFEQQKVDIYNKLVGLQQVNPTLAPTLLPFIIKYSNLPEADLINNQLNKEIQSQSQQQQQMQQMQIQSQQAQMQLQQQTLEMQKAQIAIQANMVKERAENEKIKTIANITQQEVDNRIALEELEIKKDIAETDGLISVARVEAEAVKSENDLRREILISNNR